MKNKINFKQPKYIFPLIAFPFILFIGYQINSFMSDDDKKEQKNQEELESTLGSVEGKILSKNEAYDRLFEKTRDSRSMIQDFDKETDSLFQYTDNLNEQQKRFLDSLKYEREKNRNNEKTSQNKEDINLYFPSKNNEYEDKDFEQSREIIKLLNETKQEKEQPQEEYDPVKGLKEQMLFIDSLEKSKDPEYKARQEAERRLKENKEKLQHFLNNTNKVSKIKSRADFNHIGKEKESDVIKAVIDENIKGFLGSRIRIRLLEDVLIKNMKVKKGTFLYAEISGFSMQRVNLNIVSIMVNNEILPINLSIYDMDGLRGLYVPASSYREMMRELGSNSVQGMNIENGQQGFFTSLASSLFKSASQSIVNIIRKNKVTLKYNSYILLINEKDLKKNEY
ncbi:conjugative transposon protein TraM [Capnocytophaga stomatis]|uniref:conjugative transposon protein TraM n=1 Tax=Capnocytophaga stomatis TaxID=1848904 RepID=UPI00194F6AAB|nr:conjugative transposon protein TraM [Capnocytophaga stomatis]GIJ95364.1 conjugative transposon protein TraM [Capnocytophaga stomatis]